MHTTSYQATSVALERTLTNKFKLNSDMVREDSSASMAVALREALLNMLMHANYYESAHLQAYAKINYYEFINPGKMKIPVEDFFITNKTATRNPIISKLFVQLGKSERAGHGGEKIFESAQINNYKNPSIETNNVETKLKIWNVDYADSFSGKDINDRERSSLKSIISTPTHTLGRKEIEKNTGLSKKQSIESINHLIEIGALIKQGKSRSTKYAIPSSPMQVLAQMEAMPQLYRKILGQLMDDRKN